MPALTICALPPEFGAALSSAGVPSTQIEPAKPYCFPSDGFCSPGYEGAYGRSGVAAQTAYMDHTAEWAAAFRSLRS